MENNKIISIGEALIDWVCLDKTLDLNNANNFIKAFGGAPANVAIGLAKLNYPIRFLGGFSEDIFGPWLKEYFRSFGVELDISVDVKNSNTRNAYVFTDSNGNRVFKGFTLSNCADVMFDIKDVNLDIISKAPIVYFGSLLQSDEHCRQTIAHIVSSIGKENITVYDPNLRLSLWPDKDFAVNVVKNTIKSVDILKLSDDEIPLISDEPDLEKASRAIFKEYNEKYNLKLLVVTLGSKGSFYINKNGSGFAKPFQVQSVELTGAGDAFVAGLLGGIYDYLSEQSPDLTGLTSHLDNLPPERLDKILNKANATGALTTTKHGATSALPTKKELEDFLHNIEKFLINVVK